MLSVRRRVAFSHLASLGVLSTTFWEPGGSWTEDSLPWDHRTVQVGRNLRGGLQSSPLLTAGSTLRSDKVALGFVLSDLETPRDGDCTTSVDNLFCLIVLIVMFFNILSTRNLPCFRLCHYLMLSCIHLSQEPGSVSLVALKLSFL